LDEVEIGNCPCSGGNPGEWQAVGQSKWWLKRSRGGNAVSPCRFTLRRQSGWWGNRSGAAVEAAVLLEVADTAAIEAPAKAVVAGGLIG
jgi:hypothetical protein